MKGQITMINKVSVGIPSSNYKKISFKGYISAIAPNKSAKDMANYAEALKGSLRARGIDANIFEQNYDEMSGTINKKGETPKVKIKFPWRDNEIVGKILPALKKEFETLKLTFYRTRLSL